MNHGHEDRIAERPQHLCAAYGCPLIGSMSSSTTGSTEWWCFAHFGANAGKLQAITSEMHRLRWLSMAVHDVRHHPPGTAESRAAFQMIERQLTAHQRPDLLWKRKADHHSGGEARSTWLARLESALRHELSPVLDSSAYNPTMPAGGGEVATFSKVGFDMPA
ncbi:hypothetical protein IP91_00105 [Pseudoduganella lurida]|uniref:Uncharacterized protein n=1 Tax=Pseudoduganella lurida TaxID=1036180 RepID=A0A562RKU1_9BURK|nr:hypothetical protein [Pseudoduganella lurida]TWI69040.1 hypothetical protein IP91_00105 [Pseudoduganella lurida]